MNITLFAITVSTRILLAKYFLNAKYMTKNILQIAHRGNSHFYKDNSKEAFLSAIDENFDMIELDIQICKTGEIIIYHDTYIESQMIIDMTYSEIIEKDDKILLLEELFQIEQISSVKLYLDLKGSLSLIDALVKLLQSLRKKECIELKNLYVASFNLQHIEKMYNFYPTINYGFITGNNFESLIYYTFLQRKYINFLSVCWTMLNKRTCQIIHGIGIQIFTYTCENDTILKEMMRYNIDGIVTNYKLTL